MRTTSGRSGGALLAVAAAAWVVLLIWSRSGAVGYLDHEGLEHPTVLRVGLLAAGWVLMVLAMMLPPSLPFVGALRRSDRHRQRVAVLVVGFLLVWVGAGLALTTFDIGVHRTVDAVPALGSHAWVVLALTVLVAAAYHRTPLRRQALNRCRRPTQQVAATWRCPGPVAASRVGLRHGVDCVGACAGVMLMVFALGMSNVLAMAAASAVVFAERRFAVGSAA